MEEEAVVESVEDESTVDEVLSRLVVSAGFMPALLGDATPGDELVEEVELVTVVPGTEVATGVVLDEDVVRLDIIRRGSMKERSSSLAKQRL